MDTGDTKKRDRHIIDKDPTHESTQKRRKIVETGPIEVFFVPTLVTVEYGNDSEAFLALHKSKEDRDGFFKWMKSLEDVYKYIVIVVMEINEDPKLIAEEMEEAFKRAFEEDKNEKREPLKKIEDDLGFFFGQERKNDFLGVWVHQNHVTLNANSPKPLKSNGNLIDLSQLLLIKFTGILNK